MAEVVTGAWVASLCVLAAFSGFMANEVRWAARQVAAWSHLKAVADNRRTTKGDFYAALYLTSGRHATFDDVALFNDRADS